jgi:predicted MPP superfamily phosphohydrolase
MPLKGCVKRDKWVLLSLLIMALSSCTSIRYTGVKRIRDYEISSPNVPPSFNGYRIAFASDFHLESKFKERQLHGTVKALQATAPDVLLLGGDYQEGCEYVLPLLAELGRVVTPDGTFAVLGNNDYERCTELIRRAMREQGMTLLEDTIATLYRGDDSITLWGANAYAGRYPTAPKKSSISTRDTSIDENSFTILLTHTPDYVEDTDVSGVDLALAGHTHGGQVTLFGLYAPITASKYGSRFRTGLRRNSQGVPIIISGGLGTSRRNIRFCAPTDIIIVTLRRTTAE